MYSVRVDQPTAQFGRLLLEQFGGPDGERAAAMRYFPPGKLAGDQQLGHVYVHDSDGAAPEGFELAQRHKGDWGFELVGEPLTRAADQTILQSRAARHGGPAQAADREPAGAAGSRLRAVRGGGRTRLRLLLVGTLGPALVASVAYVEPGNSASNFQSGASSGYRLLWVVVLTGAMAMLVALDLLLVA